MTDAEFGKFQQFLVKYATMFPQSSVDFQDAFVAQAWWDSFVDVEFETFGKGLLRLQKTSKWLPTLSDALEAVRAYSLEASQAQAKQQLLSLRGQVTSPEPESAGPHIMPWDLVCLEKRFDDKPAVATNADLAVREARDWVTRTEKDLGVKCIRRGRFSYLPQVEPGKETAGQRIHWKFQAWFQMTPDEFRTKMRANGREKENPQDDTTF